MFKDYADYCERMRALPSNQQWAMHLSAQCGTMIVHNTALESATDDLSAWLMFKEDGSLAASLNMNDTFYYASSDAEDIEPCDVLLLSQAERKFAGRGAVEWAARKRGVSPLRDTDISESEWAAFLADLDALCAAATHFLPWWAE